MKKLFILGSCGVVVLAVVLFFVLHKAPGSSGDIINMAKNGASETEMLSAIDKSTPTKLPSPDDIIALKQAGASDKVIIALLNKNAAKQASGK